MFYGRGMLGMSNGSYSQIYSHAALVSELLDSILNGVRSELEKIDVPQGFV